MVCAKNYETASTFVKVIQRKLLVFSGHSVQSSSMPWIIWMTFIGRYVTLAEINKIYEPTRKTAAKCRPMIVVSKNIRYMRIFAGIPWGVSCQTSVMHSLRPSILQCAVSYLRPICDL